MLQKLGALSRKARGHLSKWFT